MRLQERLRFELSRIADEECYDGGSHQLIFLRQSEARELRDALDARDARIAELEGIILWALGENGEFPDIPENWDALKYKPMYYWRKEMRVRFDRAREALK